VKAQKKPNAIIGGMRNRFLETKIQKLILLHVFQNIKNTPQNQVIFANVNLTMDGYFFRLQIRNRSFWQVT